MIANSIRFITLILSSVPSILVGVFSYALIVVTTKAFSSLAGGFALGIIMLPVVALTTEQALKLVPTSYRFASAALGGGRFQTMYVTHKVLENLSMNIPHPQITAIIGPSFRLRQIYLSQSSQPDW